MCKFAIFVKDLLIYLMIMKSARSRMNLSGLIVGRQTKGKYRKWLVQAKKMMRIKIRKEEI